MREMRQTSQTFMLFYGDNTWIIACILHESSVYYIRGNSGGIPHGT